MIDFGTNFRKLREWANLSQEALASSLNVSASVVNRIENNKRRLDIYLIHKLAIVLDLEVANVVTMLFEGKMALSQSKSAKMEQ
jgi:transcriptional regulator with XRE-family HTH domain